MSTLKATPGNWAKLVDVNNDKLSTLQKKAAVTRTTLEKVDRFKELPVGEYQTHAESSCVHPDGPCADEVLDGFASKVVDVNKADCTSKEDCDGHTWESYFFKHKKGGNMLAKKLTKTFVPARKLEEDNLDGMSDQMVTVKKGSVDGEATPRWTRFYSSPEEAQAKKPVAAKSLRSSLEKVKVRSIMLSLLRHQMSLLSFPCKPTVVLTVQNFVCVCVFCRVMRPLTRSTMLLLMLTRWAPAPTMASSSGTR